MLFAEAKNKEKIKYILGCEKLREELLHLDEVRCRYLETPIEPVPFNLYKLFYTEGDRSRFEQLYFARRGRLITFAMAVLLYNRREDIQALEDIIWAICDEYSWVVPAHSKDEGERYDRNVIDLFSAETGFALAEIHYLLSDRLDAKINRRITESVEERIFNVYENCHFGWETINSNWAAVCAGSVGAAYIYLAPKRFEKVYDRIFATLQCFLSGFGGDGCCVEGVGYWNYGFGYFTYFAQLLYELTNGEKNLFDIPICHKIAKFQQNVFLRRNITVSFSDASPECGMFPGLSVRLYEIYGIDVPSFEYAQFDDDGHRFAAYLRNFFWFRDDIPQNNMTVGEVYYPDAKWYICNNKKLSLAAKAGHNDESHNHNDVGSFLLADDCGQILCDFGSGRYDRGYFDPDMRYDYLCNAARGHSLPIINGVEQHAGKEFCGKVEKASNGEFVTELVGAYQNCGISSFKRKLCLVEDVFTLRDNFAFTKEENRVIERFVTLKKPELNGNDVVIAGHTLSANIGKVRISSENLIEHMGREMTMYMIDYTLDNQTEFILTIK